jgi:Flp pilus assembly protein TadG
MALSAMRHLPTSRMAARGSRGGAVVELAISALFLLLMVFGIVDFGRALLVRHAITSMSREAGNLESRGTPMTVTLDATLDSSGPTNLREHGYVILTAVQRDQRGGLSVTQQVAGGGLPQRSKVGTTGSPDVTLPNSGVPLRGQTLHVAEIFVRFTPVTPIGSLLGPPGDSPLILYDVAYF